MSPVIAAMLSDPASIALFLTVTVLVAVVSALVLPRPLAGIRLRHLIPILAVIGPALCAVLILVGAGSMLLAGHEVEVLFVMASAIGVALVLLGHRLARPLVGDLELVSSAIYDLAEGRRQPVALPGETAEAMMLMRAVEDLRQSLVSSEEAKEKADRHRNTVVAGLSHDLRTPLHSLLAASEALADGVGGGADAAKQARHVMLNARTLDRLVGDLFLVAQAESGFLRFDLQPIELAELVEESIEAAQPMAASRGVAIDSRVDERVVVVGDEMAIGRILQNLIDNAIRHTPPGGSVTLGINKGDKGAAVVVVDEGPGFAVAAPEVLSQPSPGRPLNEHGGIGLGLSIASTLARAVGGFVEVRPGDRGVAIAGFRWT